MPPALFTQHVYNSDFVPTLFLALISLRVSRLKVDRSMGNWKLPIEGKADEGEAMAEAETHPEAMKAWMHKVCWQGATVLPAEPETNCSRRRRL
jgi:hypothetical protein